MQNPIYHLHEQLLIWSVAIRPLGVQVICTQNRLAYLRLMSIT